jgi:hypothetical protein
MKRTAMFLVACAALAAPALAGSADDDLQAVKRAVLASNAQPARPLPEDPQQPKAEAKPAPRPRGDAMWLRVRVTEKTGKGARVAINLPIGLVRAVGEDWPLPYEGCRKHGRCGTTLGEILRTLDAGQSLVEIDDQDASVRVWVE